jgi:hypothetical protein
MITINKIGIEILSKNIFIIPIITSTALTTIGFDALVSIPPFLDSSIQNYVISKWFKIYFNRSVFTIISLGTISTISGTYAWINNYGSLYGLGAFLSGIHFGFVPLIMYKVKDIIEEKGDTKEIIKKWLNIHKIRLISDTISTICFGIALTKYVKQLK